LSDNHSEEFDCPNCGTLIQFTLWSSVNVTVDHPLKNQLMDGTLTSYSCSNCEQSGMVEHDLLYHDMKKLLLIWLKVPDKEGNIEIVDEAETSFSEINPNYSFRLVTSFWELMEKIKIFDDGYDDYSMELMKFMVSIKGELSLNEPLFYDETIISKDEGKSISLALPEKNEEAIVSYEDHFEPMMETISELRMAGLIKEDKWPIVNRITIQELLDVNGLLDEFKG
jgi:hypothetical protein